MPYKWRQSMVVNIITLKNRYPTKAEKEERWKIAQAQGCSYKEFLELEELSRRSEEYEKLMGLN